MTARQVEQLRAQLHELDHPEGSRRPKRRPQERANAPRASDPPAREAASSPVLISLRDQLTRCLASLGGGPVSS